MRYVNAQDIFPAQLLELIQQHCDGVYLYIPRKQGEKRPWGEGTHSKELTRARNREMLREHLAGMSAAQLAERYFLTEKSVRRILRAQAEYSGK